jgi:hypothetical protein
MSNNQKELTQKIFKAWAVQRIFLYSSYEN